MPRRKTKNTNEEQAIKHHQSNIKRLTRILQTLKDLARGGTMVDIEVEKVTQQIKDVRELYKLQLKTIETKKRIKESA